MREQIQAYVNGLFADAALTIRNAEVRQEILQHTLDRYDDLVASGKPEQEAYDEAVAGIGDVSELYEHKPAEKQAEAPKSARDFPAPPAAPYTAPAAPAKKKKFPGWAIALICAAVVLLAVLVLNFAGTAAFTVLRTGERYIYDHAGAYETLGRSGFGSEQVMADIDEIEIHWLSGSVYLVESETDGVTFQEDYTGDVDDYRLRYAVEDGKLVIQPCRLHGPAEEDPDRLPAEDADAGRGHRRDRLRRRGAARRADQRSERHHHERRDHRTRHQGRGIRPQHGQRRRPPAIAPGGGQQHRLRYRLRLYEPWLRGLPGGRGL